jgi:cob(I)alamin adenosyltransferase
MVYLARIYTKTGDTGETGLGDGQRVAKDSLRVAAYGSVDELNATLGLLVAHVPDYPLTAAIRRIQNDLFDLGADLCIPPNPTEAVGHALRIVPSQIDWLERTIDAHNAKLTPLRSFILPGGTPASAWLHLARTVCRRAERELVTLLRAEPDTNPQTLVYLNRLSDLLFVLGRIANDEGRADVLWVPGQARGG